MICRMGQRKESDTSDPSQIRVLIVDNDRAHAEAMCDSLERIGYQCAMAPSGPEGARRIEEGNFEVVITDLRSAGGEPLHEYLLLVLCKPIGTRAGLPRGDQAPP